MSPPRSPDPVRVELQRVLNVQRKRTFIAMTVGYCVSLYATYISIRFDNDADYSAACDINSVISCTTVLSSEYAYGLGIVGYIFGEDSLLNQKNSVLGAIIYFALALLQVLPIPSALSIYISLFVAVILNMSTIYLFIILLQLGTICLVCYTIYAVNFAFLIITLKRKDTYLELLKLRREKQA